MFSLHNVFPMTHLCTQQLRMHVNLFSLVEWLCYVEAKTPPHPSCHPIGPPGALYIAAYHEIVRYFLNGSSEDILISGLAEVTDIAVDYHDDMVSKFCYILRTF